MTAASLTPRSLLHKGVVDHFDHRMCHPFGLCSAHLVARSPLNPFAQQAPRDQSIPQLDRVCSDPRCRSSRLVLRERRPNHLYESPVPMPTRDYPCTVCGRLGIDWPHWYRPPASTTHVVQCADCLLIIAAVTVTP